MNTFISEGIYPAASVKIECVHIDDEYVSNFHIEFSSEKEMNLETLNAILEGIIHSKYRLEKLIESL
jgi:hypothetical protein